MTSHLSASSPTLLAPSIPPNTQRGGSFARLGRWTATHLGVVVGIWLIVLIIFGYFAPKATNSLAGAGWDASTSQSVEARTIIRQQFGGLGSSALQIVVVDHSHDVTTDPTAIAVVAKAVKILDAQNTISKVVLPQSSHLISTNGHTEIIEAGARVNTNAMVQTALAVATPLHQLSTGGVSVELTGSSALWADFNATNHSAMMHSEMLSWPVTLAILIVAFGSVVAAGLPLMLTIVGLVVAAGALTLLNHLAPISIWALNFALMFALALGIDYALFLVVRFRSALAGRNSSNPTSQDIISSVAETMDTAGKAVAFSALTVLGSLAAILIVPSPAFRSMALGIMLAVVAVLAATLTLLPAILGKLGAKVNSGRVLGRAKAPHSSNAIERFLRFWTETLWRRPILVGIGALVVLILAASPLVGLRTAMPSITIIGSSANARVGYTQASNAFGPGSLATFDVLVPVAQAASVNEAVSKVTGIRAIVDGPSNRTWEYVQVIPDQGPSSPVLQGTLNELRTNLPEGSLVGGAVAENLDLQHVLSQDTPIVFGVLGVVGFALLLIALGAPLIAALGVSVTFLSVGAAFGIGRLIFQDGLGSSILGFTSQGFVDAWAPLFFVAMVFGVAMDYTLFLLSVAKENYEHHSDPKSAAMHAMGSSGRVVVSAAIIMVGVFVTFALSGPLAPKEMGTILALAVAFDAAISRLVLLPLVLRLGNHNAWATPRWLSIVLPKVRFSH